MIPILNLTRQYEQLKEQINQALIQVASSGVYILGFHVQAFEKEAAEYLGVKHVIGCANGSDALFLGLRALKIGAGDEVITTPFSYIATSEAIVRAGAKPVFVDIEPDTFNLDPALIESAITPQTKAILPVHLFGQSAEMDAIQAIAKKYGLFVIEDCAQAIGAEYKGKKVGGFGDIGCFSFFPTKNLGAFGDGGMLSTNNDHLAERLRMLRVHGSRQRYYHDEAGINSRLDEMQAAILRIKLPYLEQWTQARQQVAKRYDDLLKPLADALETPMVREYNRHVFHQYTISIKTDSAQVRDELQTKLQELGVQSMIYYPVPFYRQKTHEDLGYSAADFPKSETAAKQVLSLPMFPEITEEEQQTVAQALTQAVKALPTPIAF